MALHRPLREIVGAMEERLALELVEAGYAVMNSVKWRHDVATEVWLPIRQAFVEDFPKLTAIA
jgi:hypothetical protein